MSNGLTLLSDEQMQQFITKGYLKLNAEFPTSFHERILKQINEVYDREGNVGNNLLPRIPEIGNIFEHSTVRGALTSLLGSGYIMSSHRHGHLTKGGAGSVFWHKDNYWFNEKIRNHRPWSALIFYYTQDVTPDMGPSSIMPGTQNYYNLRGDDSEPWLPVCGKAGTLALIDYNLWHTATENVSNIDRYMFKFQFFRMEAPAAPEWDNRNPVWTPPAELDGIDEHRLQWQSAWNWLSGSSVHAEAYVAAASEAAPAEKQESLKACLEQLNNEDRQVRLRAIDDIGLLGSDGAGAIPDLARLLHETDEGISLNAAYALGSVGPDAIAPLIEGLRSTFHPTACNAAHGLIECGAAAVPALIALLEEGEEAGEARAYAALALGEIGHDASAAIPSLISLLQDSSPFVRQHAVEAFGVMRLADSVVIDEVCKVLLEDPKDFIRFTAGLSLARMGPLAAQAVPALESALTDSYRYVPSVAVDALDRIHTPEALTLLIAFLKRARWCPVTNRSSAF
ncbi:HEAT repeat domain-containing protein [Paenibacillus mendelii]|uniref:HEAT repeat domain-containing protein n=1 Tax=Paenibacillus mendelii TaxID=206163 RepID=A0ABV6JL01_9BACL|nr:HEAT repeat domain-containing protein [Paenibacillus mendelii]MCQ6560659.1 HEAT repeat domain-containing protein [Paenibacillus mendelii]